MVILSLPLFQEGLLSIARESMCTNHHQIIIRFLINMQVQGHHPHQWAPFQVIPLTAVVLGQFLTCQLGPPRTRLSSTCISHAFLNVPLERSTCPDQRIFLSLKMRSRSSTSSLLDLTVAKGTLIPEARLGKLARSCMLI